jgi:SAM-dependent methyltransferase
MKDFWNQRYSGSGFSYGELPNDFLAEVADRLPPGPLLCLGEGEGRNAVFLARRGHAVTAVDQSEVGLAKARALAARHQISITTIVADLADFELGSGWAAIISIWCHLPGALRERLHDAIPAALAPGGAFVIEAYTPAQIPFGTGGPKDPDMLPTAAELAEGLPGLTWELLAEREREVDEGAFHGGRSAVVAGLAFKRRGVPSA